MSIRFKYLLVLGSSLCILLQLRAQHIAQMSGTLTDSLQHQLLVQKNDTNKVALLNAISYNYNTTSPYDGIRYGEEALHLAEELHWETGIARANSCLGANYYSLSDFPNAYKYWLAALKINEETGNTGGVANHLHNIGNVFFSQKNYTEALDYYKRALAASKEGGDKNFATNSYTAIGNVYEKLNDYQQALDYHFKALELDRKLSQERNIAADEINIGSVYNEMGSTEKATKILFQALQIKRVTGDKNGQAKAYSTIGRTFLRSAGDSTGAINDKTSRLKWAVLYLDSAIAIDKEIGFLDNLQNSYDYVARAHEMLSDYKEALYSSRHYYIIKDSIFSGAKQREIFNLEKKAELEGKERATEKEKEKKERKEYLEAAGISVFVLAFLSLVILLSHREVNPKYIDILGTLSVLIFFEFIELLLHARIEEITHHDMILTLLCLLVLASIIIPVHHKLEHWMKKKTGHGDVTHLHH